MKAIIDSYDPEIPRTRSQVEWRLVLNIRHMRRHVGVSTPALVSWVDLRRMFCKKGARSLRDGVMYRLKKALSKSSSETIDTFSYPPEPKSPGLLETITDQGHSLAISKTTLE